MKKRTGNVLVGIIMILVIGGSIAANGQSIGDTVTIKPFKYLQTSYQNTENLRFTTSSEKGKVLSVDGRLSEIELFSTGELVYVHQMYIKPPPTPSDQAIRSYKERYGQPDETSDYRDGSYWSKTLTYHCVDGKYRSTDFVFQSGRWILESSYTSDCI